MKTILLLFTPILLFSGCIRETLDQCPKGDIEINVYVEKFQAVTHNYRTDMETSTHVLKIFIIFCLKSKH